MGADCNYLYVLFGTPGSGKTTTLRMMDEIAGNSISVIKKYSTRAKREDDGADIESGLKKIPKKCDFRYIQYQVEYGFSSNDIWEAFKSNFSAVLVVNDILVIKTLRQVFGDQMKTIYLHRNISGPNIVDLQKNRKAENDGSTAHRVNKAYDIYRKYIENTSLFDEVILNLGTPAQLRSQIREVLHSPLKFSIPRRTTSRVFIISGTSGSGKDELVTAMSQMQRTRVYCFQKHTTREKRATDRNELIHEKVIPDRCDVVYTMQTHQYGIDTGELWGHLHQRRIVLLVLNHFDSIMLLKSMFAGFCTSIYLHATKNIDELRQDMKNANIPEMEMEKRCNAIKEHYTNFVQRKHTFDHVIFHNTNALEDLYEQAFNLLDYYCW